VGISFDTPEDNRAFAEQDGFPFRFLSDVDREVGRLYETVRAPDESSPEYAKRRTYLIDPDGVVRRSYRVTDIPAHPDQVLEDVRELTGEG
jgi:peroxiredoxin Q/BCP